VDRNGPWFPGVQQQLAHVLARLADEFCDIGVPNEVGCRFDESRFRQSITYIADGTENRILSGLGLAYEVEGNSSGNADACDGVIASARRQLLEAFLRAAANGTDVESEREVVLIHESTSTRLLLHRCTCRPLSATASHDSADCVVCSIC